MKILLFLITILLSMHCYAQFKQAQIDKVDNDNLNIGGNIFSDFDEDLEANQVMEDERFYRYGRFYSLNLSFGFTTYTGNRGVAYEDRPPSLGLSLLYFMNFRVAFGLGVAFSKHFFVINEPVIGFDFPGGPGLIEVNMFRTFFFYRYYFDTSDLGTAITYANPYFVGRLEYWNQTNKFIDQTALANDSNGAMGGGFGLGLEFPMKIKESYLGVELIYHLVSFKDTFSQIYRPVQDGGQGFNDLSGDAISLFISYVINW